MKPLKILPEAGSETVKLVSEFSFLSSESINCMKLWMEPNQASNKYACDFDISFRSQSKMREFIGRGDIMVAIFVQFSLFYAV